MVKCIVHYNAQTKYSTERFLSEQTIKRLLEAKAVRERLGGENYENHFVQCNSVSNELNETHQFHPECYKKFTLILSGQSSTQEDPPQELRRSTRRPSVEGESSVAWVYPPECNICKKLRVQHNNKKVFPKKIVTYQCAASVKANAKDKDE